MSETDLAKKLIPWLTDQHWDIYPEFVERFSGGSIDILAVRGKITWAIEVKKSLSLKVMEQAASRSALYRSVFVPGSRTDRRRAEHLAKHWFKVGVLETSVHNSSIREVYRPPLMREHYRYQKYILGRLTELHKTFSEPGIKNGQRLTPYRESMLTVERFIKQNPGCTVKEVFEALGKLHYASGQSFRSSLVSSLRSFEKEWCIVDENSKPFKLYHASRRVTDPGG
jgi:hypothetical protein